MTYQEAESFLFTELQSFQDKGRIAFNGTLENALALSDLLGHPHEKFKSIHIAGTNGKGSVSHMIAAGLQENGYVVGLYTSPHYKSYRERIKINGQHIPEIEVANFIQTYQEDIKRIQPSFFEITCAMAFNHFAKNNVDVAIIEVGLGGRLDSTNIITPLISVITNISYDHQRILGNTLSEIASEKAGIIKQNVPVVIGETQEKIQHVFNQKAAKSNSKISYADTSTTLETDQEDADYHIFSVLEDDWKIRFKSPFANSFQLKNLKTALYTLYELRNHFKCHKAMIAHGLQEIVKSTNFIGRWTQVKEKPLVIFDSAHNLAGVQYITEQIKKLKYKSLKLVWGTTKEKNVDQILSILPKEATYYFCQANNSRALDVEMLQNKANNHDLNGYAYTSVEAAYRVALSESDPEDLIIVAGSTFVIAEII